MAAKTPDFGVTLSELDAGILLSKLSKVTAQVALGVIEHNKKGQIVLTIDMTRIGESAQVNVKHKISYTRPTLRGDTSENDTTQTPMHVNKLGHLSVSPDTQLDIFKPQRENA
jgi:hypothetical protein